MTKGWYGNRQQHSMASKGIRTKNNKTGYEAFSRYRVGVVDENGKEYYEFFDNPKDAYERFIEYRSEGNETWYEGYDVKEKDYEGIQSYDPEEDDTCYFEDKEIAKQIASEFNVDIKNDNYVRELIQLFADWQINETSLRDRLYEYESEITTHGEPEKEYKDFNQSAKIGVNKFVKLNTNEMDNLFLKFEQETGLIATNINNKERFYSWVSREFGDKSPEIGYKSSGISSYVESPLEEISYRNHTITRQFPSGYYMYYSEKDKGFFRADELDVIKSRIRRGE